MVNIIPPDHVDDVPVVEPNQHDDVPVVLEPVVVDEDEDRKRKNLRKKMMTWKLTSRKMRMSQSLHILMKRWILLTLCRLLLSQSLRIVHEVGELSTALFLREDSDGLLHGLMRRDINYLFDRMTSLSRRMCGCETVHVLVEKKVKAKDKYY
nr:hypothetical protein [Tanacetum cinerariifolium]